ncbi:MarR family winged helix-turn-helix transcriptional regulator [Streptococcus macacae]|uniref:Sugar-specific transcriptional regulator, TrmB family n=1 Tax=Streptococcus macacae NCTC 11558 TaxID=764298 RepID=G5JV30_9STRE|nr:MarR family transcriptional regulator [Streptococcus macacae]EHJ53322.1 sugar-specific transcriptional regulator, TrmB family [Streptococcus macacae NCTC 11558]SUN79334.1 transcriptional regulator [Streptococcus macacae NCTC 11558]
MDLEESWGFNLSKIAQKMDDCFSQDLKTFDIDSRDYGILVKVFNNNNLTQIDLGDLLQIDRTTIGQLINQLEDKGLLERQKNPEDKRQNRILLTAQGKSLVVKKWELMREIEERVSNSLSKSQQKTILMMSEKIKGGKDD